MNKPMRQLSGVACGLLLTAMAAAQGLGSTEPPDRGLGQPEQEWEFRVLLDGSEIGTHQFELQNRGDSKLLQSIASFDVKFLFFSAFRYRHENTEQWSDGCLVDIEARTVTNGKAQTVQGTRDGDNFIVRRGDDKVELPSCVMTFAYWNPSFLEQPRLLNPQTGEFLEVEVESMQAETLTVRGEEREAQRYRLSAKGMDLQLWYSQDNEWLALESVAKGGRIIRYELI